MNFVEFIFRKLKDIKELADIINKLPHHWTKDNLWAAYAALEKSKVRGASGARMRCTDNDRPCFTCPVCPKSGK